MIMRFVCRTHKKELVGEPTWFRDDSFVQYNYDRNGLIVTAWKPDLSEMTCPEADDCQVHWTIDMFDDDGYWLAVTE